MELDELKENLKRISKDIMLFNKERRICELDIAILTCPFSIGDRIINRKLNEKGEITSIIYSGYRDLYAIEIKKIKVNGDLYAIPSRVYRNENWEIDAS